mmetsp:Transcript_10539/g.16126  ORF Transcript_10539/g.16126 Transcript_10539/m.16126 type:complete len:215 (-) Transcript_10539:53-697(-)
MTPLNGLINSSRMVSKKLTQMTTEISKLFNKQEPLPRTNSLLSVASARTMSKLASSSTNFIDDSIFSFVKTIEHTAQQIYYHNLNQITRLKIKRNKLQQTPVPIGQPETFVKEILGVFESNIKEFQLGVFVGRCNDFSHLKVKTDWTIYKQILFNLVQNAVKFNCRKGNLMVLLRCLPLNSEAKESEAPDFKRKFDLQSAYSSLRFDQITKASP